MPDQIVDILFQRPGRITRELVVMSEYPDIKHPDCLEYAKLELEALGYSENQIRFFESVLREITDTLITEIIGMSKKTACVSTDFNRLDVSIEQILDDGLFLGRSINRLRLDDESLSGFSEAIFHQLGRKLFQAMASRSAPFFSDTVLLASP